MNTYTNEGEWRNDLHPEQKPDYRAPTITFHAIHAIDGPLERTEDYAYTIHHIYGFHGKGFMPALKFNLDPLSTPGNGNITYGTTPEHYQAAKVEGEQMLIKKQAELNQRAQERDERGREHNVQDGKVGKSTTKNISESAKSPTTAPGRPTI